MGGFKISPSAIITPFIAGHYQIGDSNLYVSRGIGTVGIPLRVNAPAEITLATLVRA
jgi:predicted MPP superfamily phosphohydrolase